MRKLEDRARVLEGKISEAEGRIRNLEERLAHFVSAEETRRLSNELEAERAALAAFETEWTGVLEAIEAL
jgi:predicted  nucleic acid-binding Zn-ribbon protein